MTPPPSEQVTLDVDRHVKYWLRCLRTLLPPAYASQDSTRSTLGFFIVEALHLLGRDNPTARLQPEEIGAIREWVLSLQHPLGGFVGNINILLPKTGACGDWQAMASMSGGNLSGTFFALLVLAQAVREETVDAEPKLPPSTTPSLIYGLPPQRAAETLKSHFKSIILDSWMLQVGSRALLHTDMEYGVLLGDRDLLIDLSQYCIGSCAQEVLAQAIKHLDEALLTASFPLSPTSPLGLTRLGESGTGEFAKDSPQMVTVMEISQLYQSRDMGAMSQWLCSRYDNTPNRALLFQARVADIARQVSNMPPFSCDAETIVEAYATPADIQSRPVEEVLGEIELHSRLMDEFARDVKLLCPPTGKEAFQGVRGDWILHWLRKLQRSDGSFGECLSNGKPHGGGDMRYCYMAAAVRWMLRRPGELQPDIDVMKLREFVLNGQSFDGGISEASTQESHGTFCCCCCCCCCCYFTSADQPAGYTFCAIATLALLERPPDGSRISRDQLQLCESQLRRLERWLAHRASHWVQGIEEDVFILNEPISYLSLDAKPSAIGFNGRQNKTFDSCYTWWVCGALDVSAIPPYPPSPRPRPHHHHK